MKISIKFLLTAGCYCLAFAGIYQGEIWAVVVGAFMAGSTTTKLTLELLEKKGQNDETVSTN